MVALTVFATAAFVALAAAFIAAALATAFVALAAAFVTAALATLATLAALAATFLATLAAFFAAAFIAATAFVAYEMTASIFEHKALLAPWDRNRITVTAFEFIARGARGRWSGHAFTATQFIVPWASWRWNHTAVVSVQHVASRAFWTVLVEACAAAPVFAVAATGKSHCAASAEHKKPDCEHCGEALFHERSLVS